MVKLALWLHSDKMGAQRSYTYRSGNIRKARHKATRLANSTGMYQKYTSAQVNR